MSTATNDEEDHRQSHLREREIQHGHHEKESDGKTRFDEKDGHPAEKKEEGGEDPRKKHLQKKEGREIDHNQRPNKKDHRRKHQQKKEGHLAATHKQKKKAGENERRSEHGVEVGKRYKKKKKKE